MERNLEHYYTEFVRPPYAPTFYPTEEEFADPISYVAKIRPTAEKYGLIKIVPPKSFRPPFCIDSPKFEFTPRVQRLNEIDALFRLRIVFINKLVKFWQIQGKQFRIPYVDNKYIDLYRLRQLVAEEGGFRKVTETRRWSHIAKTLGFKPSAGPSMKYHYNNWIHPFELNIASSSSNETANANNNNIENGQQPSTSSSAAAEENNKNNKEEEKSSPQTRSQSRMMAGAKRKARPVPSLDKSSIQGHRTPIELVVCARCGSGDDEARLLLCETCDSSMHTYCANPPLQNVPKGEWRCPKCVASALKSVSTDFGFVDSNQHFNLNTFGEWANNFKQQYFGMAPCDVPSERVEAEFWGNVIDIDKAVQVKYGADLISSKVGSGFPRREECFKGVDAKERQLYANHPWNLNNLPKLRESVLCHMNMDISGMMVPWVYVGMLFSTFCWHVEDHWTYSINFNHWGERKIWYGIPGDEAENFDRVMRESAPELFQDQSDLLHHMTTALNPRYLIDHGVSVYTVHQNAGEFVITFPRAYHSGYNEGLNFAEAVNFAPPDWLRMGRQCLENYATVRRNCVFSHEELVMKMVSVSTKMSIGMCLATLEELSWIVAKETEFRKKLMAAGLHESHFFNFEELPDDDRACIVCRTTLFCSGLICRHEGRIVCVQHFDQLCAECNFKDFCLKFRYTLEDLIQMAKRLTERTTSFFEWKDSVTELYSIVREAEQEDKEQATNGQGKPRRKIDVQKVRALAEQWKNSRFPHCEEIHRITGVLADFERLAVGINKILNRKIRLRDQTRCQKADTRREYSELIHLRQQLEQSMFEDSVLEIGLDEICKKADGWNQRVQRALDDGFVGVQSVDTLYQLLYEAEEEFNVRLETGTLERIRSELARYQWLIKAKKSLDQIKFYHEATLKKPKEEEAEKKPKKEEEEEEADDEEPPEAEHQQQKETTRERGQRVDLPRLRKLIADSVRWSNTCHLVATSTQQLEAQFAQGSASDAVASEFLPRAEGIGVEKAELCWREKLLHCNWLESQAMSIFRAELEMAQKIHANFTSMTESGFTFRRLEQLNQHCTNSLFERNGQRHARVGELLNAVGTFVERIRTIFQRHVVGYYNLFDIIAGRSDLPALVEGDPTPLALFASTKYSDNWRQLRLFDTKAQLMTHLRAITEQQAALMQALRLVNEERPLKETCSCARDICTPMAAPANNQHQHAHPHHHHNHANSLNTSSAADSASSDDLAGMTINCFVCNANFHAICAHWDAFLGRLPPGLFLCPRCLRSRRPCIEDVEAACSSSSSTSIPDYCLEKVLVQNLVQRSTNTFHQLQILLHALPKGIRPEMVNENVRLSLKECLITTLSLEVVDTEVYRMLGASAFFDLFPIPERHVHIWHKIQERMVKSEPPALIFSLSLAPTTSASSTQSHHHNQGGGGGGGGGSSGRRITGTNKRRNTHSTPKSRRQNSAEKLLFAARGKSETDNNHRHNSNNNNNTDDDDHNTTCEEEEEDGAAAAEDKAKRQRRGGANDHMEKCAADFCLKPYSEYTRWIQCEAGCARWYHFCCVGISVRGAQLISSYCCYKCSHQAQA